MKFILKLNFEKGSIKWNYKHQKSLSLKLSNFHTTETKYGRISRTSKCQICFMCIESYKLRIYLHKASDITHHSATKVAFHRYDYWRVSPFLKSSHIFLVDRQMNLTLSRNMIRVSIDIYKYIFHSSNAAYWYLYLLKFQIVLIYNWMHREAVEFKTPSLILHNLFICKILIPL